MIAIVIDQLPSWALERYLEYLPVDGAIRRGVQRGTYYARSRYDFATTFTAPGHATIYTGLPPAAHGVLANEVWNARERKVLSVVDDRKHAVFGAAGEYAGPSALRAPTVADWLERSTGGRARTASLSFKDRGAVLPAGQSPDLVLWYDWKQPAFTTSTAYAPEMPQWLTEWQGRNPSSTALGPWTPARPSELQALLGADVRPGEGDWLGLGPAFPHDARAATKPYSAFRATPHATEYLLELAREAVRQLELGRDAIPDLLMLSISGTDYVGHIFGAESWEYLDNLQRVDAALGRLLGELESEFPIAVLLTSDHGVARLPETARAQGHAAHRLLPARVADSLRDALASGGVMGGRPVIDSYTPPFLYLTEEARSSDEARAIAGRVLEAARQVPGVAAVFDVKDVLAGNAPEGTLEHQVRASLAENGPGDLYLVTAEHSIIDAAMPGGAGTNHGSPWEYDQNVPVIVWGSGVERSKHPDAVPQTRVARTLARLLGVEAFAGSAPGSR